MLDKKEPNIDLYNIEQRIDYLKERNVKFDGMSKEQIEIILKSINLIDFMEYMQPVKKSSKLYEETNFEDLIIDYKYGAELVSTSFLVVIEVLNVFILRMFESITKAISTNDKYSHFWYLDSQYFKKNEGFGEVTLAYNDNSWATFNEKSEATTYCDYMGKKYPPVLEYSMRLPLPDVFRLMSRLKDRYLNTFQNTLNLIRKDHLLKMFGQMKDYRNHVAHKPSIISQKSGFEKEVKNMLKVNLSGYSLSLYLIYKVASLLEFDIDTKLKHLLQHKPTKSVYDFEELLKFI